VAAAAKSARRELDATENLMLILIEGKYLIKKTLSVTQSKNRSRVVLAGETSSRAIFHVDSGFLVHTSRRSCEVEGVKLCKLSLTPNSSIALFSLQ
jgi:hypothetical protein